MQELSLKSKIEALLFAAGEPVAIEKLAKFLKINEQEIVEEVAKLKDFYEQNNSGLDIITKDKEFQLVSSKQQADMIAKFLNRELNEELSTAAAEVLAVVAYRGPITRAQIEQIRGVNCSFTLRNLAMRGLVERKDNPSDSRSFLYQVSFDFLKQLGLSRLEELPDYEELRNAKALSEQSTTETLKESEAEKNVDESLENPQS